MLISYISRLPILGPMNISSIGISQFSMVSLLSPLASRLISFLLLSSAEEALCRGRTLVGELVSLLLLTTPEIVINSS